MSAKPIKTILEAAPELRQLTKRSQQLLYLQRHLRDALPITIAEHTVVANFVSGNLTIATDSGAAAAKIRQLTPRLVNKLRRLEPELTAIKVSVQISDDDKPLHIRRNFLDHKAKNALLTLSSRLEASPLRSAVLRLASRANPLNNKQETLNEVNSYEDQQDNDSDS